MDRARPSNDSDSREHERPAAVRIKDASRKEGGSSSIPVRHGQNGAMNKTRTAGGRSSARSAHKEPPDAEPPAPGGVRALRDRADMGSNSSLNAATPPAKKVRSRKSTTPQPEPRIRPALKKRSYSVEVAAGSGPRRGSPHEPANGPANGDGASAGGGGGGGGGGGKAPVRLSAVRHRDRNRLDGGKVSFAPQIEWLAPGDEFAEKAETETVKEAASATGAGAESSRQAASMRKLEEENESLRRAIENYRERESDRSSRGSVDRTGGGVAPAEATDSQEEREDGEEDDVEKAVEASPNGKFLKFDEEIGRGSFKTVYKGLDTTNGVFVAWCELQMSGNRLSKKERDRFREEADLMKGLTHPNIVRFFEYWEVDKIRRRCIVLVTELMTSGTLRTYLKNFGQKKVSPKIIGSWCRQILKGLQFLHSRNPPIIHRDLKCDNIFISGTTGQVKVGDLGLATLKNRSFAKSVIGTPEFMAPEVYEEHYDEAVDVYAFGMCMLEMVTSEYPYSECTGPAQIYKKVIQGIKPSSFDKIDDPVMRELIDWCTRLNKLERPTVKELLNHEFFAEDCGMKLDVANREESISSDGSVVELRLRVLDAKKRRDKHKENEAIQFNYNLNKDNPEEIAKHMVMSGILTEEDARSVVKLINNQIQGLRRAREEKKREHAAAPAGGPVSGQPGAPPAAGPAQSQQQPAPASQQTPAQQPQQPQQHQHPHSQPVPHSQHPHPQQQPHSQQPPQQQQLHPQQQQQQQQQPPAHQQAQQQPTPQQQQQQQPVQPVQPPTHPQQQLSQPAVPTAAVPGTAAAEEKGGSAPPQLLQPADALLQRPQISPAIADVPAEGSQPTSENEAAVTAERKEKRKPSRRRKTGERLPRLTVLEVKGSDNGPVVSCLLETNQSQAITFKFDLREADVSAISYKMTEAHLLPRDDAQYFGEQLQAIIRQHLQLEFAAGMGSGAATAAGSFHRSQPSFDDEQREEPTRRTASATTGPAGVERPRPPATTPAAAAAAAVAPPVPYLSVPGGSYPVLLQAEHGLQIVSLTPQQLTALLQHSAGAGAAAAAAAAAYPPPDLLPPETAALPPAQAPKRLSRFVVSSVAPTSPVSTPQSPVSEHQPAALTVSAVTTLSEGAVSMPPPAAPSIAPAPVVSGGFSIIATTSSSAAAAAPAPAAAPVCGPPPAAVTQTVGVTRAPISHPQVAADLPAPVTPLLTPAPPPAPAPTPIATPTPTPAPAPNALDELTVAGASPELSLSPQNTEHSGVGNLEELRKQLVRLTSPWDGSFEAASQPSTPVFSAVSAADMAEVNRRLTSITSAGAAQTATGSIARSGEPDSAAAASRLGQESSMSQQLPPTQSTSDVSRSASSSETTGSERGRKATTPLLLADLEKELNKLHSGKNTLHTVASTPMLVTQDESTQSENGVLAKWETVGPIDTTHTLPIQSVSFQAGSGASTPSTDPGTSTEPVTPVRKGRFAITVSRQAAPSPPPSAAPLSPVSEPADVEMSDIFIELLAKQRLDMEELQRQQVAERERLRHELLERLRQEAAAAAQPPPPPPPPPDG